MEVTFESLDDPIDWEGSGIKKLRGRKNKTPRENAACFCLNLFNFIDNPTHRKNCKQLEKYLSRVHAMVMSETDEQTKYELARNKNMILSFFKILKNFQVFDFETRKKLIIIFKELAKLKDCDRKSDMLSMFAQQSNFGELISGLIEASQSNELVLGCVGQVLKVFAKSKETFQVFLDFSLFRDIFKLCANHNLQIASEYLELLETLVFKTDHKLRRKVSDFFYSVYNYIFLWVGQSDCLLFRRNILNLLYRLMSDPVNDKFMIYFINHKDRLKQTMVGLTNDNESIRFENYLLLSLFLTHFEGVINNDVRMLIVNNKTNLLMALSNVHPENFDNQCELGVCREELETVLRNISAGI